MKPFAAPFLQHGRPNFSAASVASDCCPGEIKAEANVRAQSLAVPGDDVADERRRNTRRLAH